MDGIEASHILLSSRNQRNVYCPAYTIRFQQLCNKTDGARLCDFSFIKPNTKPNAAVIKNRCELKWGNQLLFRNNPCVHPKRIETITRPQPKRVFKNVHWGGYIRLSSSNKMPRKMSSSESPGIVAPYKNVSVFHPLLKL